MHWRKLHNEEGRNDKIKENEMEHVDGSEISLTPTKF
jgi:hypothetical protein